MRLTTIALFLCAAMVACAHDFSFLDHLPNDDAGDADGSVTADAMDAVQPNDATNDEDATVGDADANDATDAQDSDADDADGEVHDVAFDLAFDAQEETRGDTSVVDAADSGVDSGVDAGTDVGTDVPVDRGFDVGVDVQMDLGVDVPQDVSIDLGRDVVVADDRGVDSGTDASDVGVEVMPDVPADTGIDVPPSPTGCADETAEQIYRTDMVGCNGSANQCDSATLCGSGWHLCTYAEYATRGGDTIRPTSSRWVASCIRSNGGVANCPTNSVCPMCNGMAATRADSDWSCSGGRVDDTGAANAGMLASPSVNTNAPHRLGCPSALCVWGVNGSVISSYGATCCR